MNKREYEIVDLQRYDTEFGERYIIFDVEEDYPVEDYYTGDTISFADYEEAEEYIIEYLDGIVVER